MTDIISLAQLPIITQRLGELDTAFSARQTEIMALTLSAETKAAYKKERTILRKEIDELEAGRKAVKAEIEKPYQEMLEVYNPLIGKLKAADEHMKKAIAEMEAAEREDLILELSNWFAEYTQAMGIPWLKIAQIPPKITAASTFKGVKKTLETEVNRIYDELEYIRSMENAVEVEAEFRKSLNLGKAMSTVTAAKLAKAEVEQAQAVAAQAAPVVEAAVAQVESLLPPEPLISAKFTATGTRAQLIGLRKYMEREGIKYG